MRKLLEKQIWLIPLVFAVLVGSVGWNAYRLLESSTRDRLRTQLETILNADVTALRIWVRIQQAVIRQSANDSRVQALAFELAEVARSSASPAAALKGAAAVDQLDKILRHTMREQHYIGYRVIERFGMQLAAEDRALVGERLPGRSAAIERALTGEITITRPVRGTRKTEDGTSLGAPMLFAIAPIQDPEGETFAVLAFGIDAELDFTEMLTVARMGVSGETYAFDDGGVLLSESRFNDELIAIGLLPDEPDVRSIMNIEVRDPGGNLAEGHVPELPLRARPLTRMAADAVTGASGYEVSPYRDYRGVPVVGAWSWIPELQIGIATEIDAAEAYAGLQALQTRFLAVMALLVLGTVGMFLYSGVLLRMRSKVDRAQRLGRYRVEEKIGEGGMGEVYRARHALMRRPTAIKLLRAADPNSESVKRFEREVQVTSSLTHPNTVAIYDYGHTPDGVFYYAMEYLEGANVAQVVEHDGAQPEARVVHVMKQACSSIVEAHSAGLIHRDLKPQNVMLCERGGLCDFVKVLDFGLVRQTESELSLTNVQALTGTPLYLSPEALEAPESIDGRSDLYQLGAIAYFLLTGRHVFTGESVVDVLSQHLNTKPLPPSEVLDHPVSPGLESLILACLEKDRGLRPESAAALFDGFESAECAGTWTQHDARYWWQQWRLGHPDLGHGTQSSLPSAYSIDLDGRSQSR